MAKSIAGSELPPPTIQDIRAKLKRLRQNASDSAIAPQVTGDVLDNQVVSEFLRLQVGSHGLFSIRGGSSRCLPALFRVHTDTTALRVILAGIKARPTACKGQGGAAAEEKRGRA